MTTKARVKHLGEYGSIALPGNPVYDVYAVPGHAATVMRLWSELDHCNASDVAGIIRRLVDLGAAVRQGE